VPCILGADGCGIVEQVHDEKDKEWIGKKVVINPSFSWGDDENVASDDFRILGMPEEGTFAEYIAIPVVQLHLMPAHLNVEQAAALPLAGVTAYRALFVKGGLKPGQNVLVTGVGGGVAAFLAQFAAAVGGNVFITSGVDEKITLAKNLLRITDGVNYKAKDWDRQLLHKAKNPFDLIVDGAGGKSFNMLFNILKRGGTVVSYGATAGRPNFEIHRFFLRQQKLIGSTMGSDRDFVAMLEFVNKHKLIPPVSRVRPLDEFFEALEEMKDNKQFGKLVIRIGVDSKL